MKNDVSGKDLIKVWLLGLIVGVVGITIAGALSLGITVFVYIGLWLILSVFGVAMIPFYYIWIAVFSLVVIEMLGA